MRLQHGPLALCLIAAPLGCSAAQDDGPDAGEARDPARAEIVDPMASFARMVGGEWRVTALAGTSTFDIWHWGPGRHSLRVVTDGTGSSVVPEPWRELQVFYWHPGRKQVRLLALSPFARGVGEGTIQFEGETAGGTFDLHQTGGLRRLGLCWTFDGPDWYRDVLLEATGAGGFEPLAAWDHFRSWGPPAARQPTAEKEAPRPSQPMTAFTPLLGLTWEAKGVWAAGDACHIRSTFEWIPYADGIHARTVALPQDAEPIHLLDAYVYHHTGTNALRCLALSSRGGVYEGDWTVLHAGRACRRTRVLVAEADRRSHGLECRAWRVPRGQAGGYGHARVLGQTKNPTQGAPHGDVRS